MKRLTMKNAHFWLIAYLFVVVSGGHIHAMEATMEAIEVPALVNQKDLMSGEAAVAKYMVPLEQAVKCFDVVQAEELLKIFIEHEKRFEVEKDPDFFISVIATATAQIAELKKKKAQFPMDDTLKIGLTLNDANPTDPVHGHALSLLLTREEKHGLQADQTDDEIKALDRDAEEYLLKKSRERAALELKKQKELIAQGNIRQTLFEQTERQMRAGVLHPNAPLDIIDAVRKKLTAEKVEEEKKAQVVSKRTCDLL